MAAKCVSMHLDQRMAAVGCSLYDHIVLRNIEDNQGLTQRELAERMGIEGPTLSHHLDRLVADGMVERVRGTGDRRTVCPVLTATGKAQLRRSRRAAEQFQAEMDGLFTAEELRTLHACLDRLIEHYGRMRRDDDRARTA